MNSRAAWASFCGPVFRAYKTTRHETQTTVRINHRVPHKNTLNNSPQTETATPSSLKKSVVKSMTLQNSWNRPESRKMARLIHGSKGRPQKGTSDSSNNEQQSMRRPASTCGTGEVGVNDLITVWIHIDKHFKHEFSGCLCIFLRTWLKWKSKYIVRIVKTPCQFRVRNDLPEPPHSCRRWAANRTVFLGQLNWKKRLLERSVQHMSVVSFAIPWPT